MIKKHGKDLSSNDFTDGYKKKLDSIEKIYKFKGNVNTYTELSAISASNGDVYNVLDEGNNYAWNGTEWIELGFIIDMSEFAYKEDVNEIKSIVNENAEKLTIVSPTEPTGDNREKVWIQKGNNILIPSNGSTAISNNDNNTYTFKSDLPINWYSYIAKAKLKANTQYTISVSSNLLYGRLALSSIPEGEPDRYPADIIIETSNEDDALHLLSAEKTITSATFTSNSDQLVYLRYCSDAERTNLSSFAVSIQLEQGSVATEYEPYIEKKIFVKNDNGVYEEFVNVEKIENLKNKSAITAALQGDVTTAHNVGFDALNEVQTTMGNDLFFDTDHVVCNRDGYVEISAIATVKDGGIGGNLRIDLIQNTTSFAGIPARKNSVESQGYSIPPKIRKVSAGDTLCMRVQNWTGADIIIVGDTRFTYMTVKYID